MVRVDAEIPPEAVQAGLIPPAFEERGPRSWHVRTGGGWVRAFERDAVMTGDSESIRAVVASVISPAGGGEDASVNGLLVVPVDGEGHALWWPGSADRRLDPPLRAVEGSNAVGDLAEAIAHDAASLVHESHG